MGIEPFLAASSLLCVIAQRLVRVICPHCREPYTPADQEKAFLEPGLVNEKDPPLLYRGRGCDRCMGKGYAGRTGIFELLEITPVIRNMIVERKDAQTIKSHAVSAGFEEIRVDGIKKVLRGITTIEEVLRVTQQDSAT